MEQSDLSPHTNSENSALSDQLLLPESSGSSDSNNSFRRRISALSSGDRDPTSTAAPSARRLGLHMTEPRDGKEVREEMTRAQTGALNMGVAADLTNPIGPCEGGRV